MDFKTLRYNLAETTKKIVDAAERTGRDPEAVKLVAVTKTVGVEEIRQLVDLGVRHIGESRVQDAKDKYRQLHSLNVDWHMIGHLQRNKASDACKIFSWIHSIDSVRLAQDLQKQAAASQQRLPILVQVNVSGERSKFGFDAAEIERHFAEIAALESLDVVGLMTMAPMTKDLEVCRKCFRRTRMLGERLSAKNNVELREFSMGMSQDFPIAIEEGATIVRIGSALFRPSQQVG